jgi:hypothetical protein
LDIGLTVEFQTTIQVKNYYDNLSNPGPVGEDWLIDRIVGERFSRRRKGFRRRTKQFRVRFLGYGPKDDEWLSWREVRQAEALDTWLTGNAPLDNRN